MSESNCSSVIFGNEVCTLKNYLIGPFLKNTQIENGEDALGGQYLCVRSNKIRVCIMIQIPK